MQSRGEKDSNTLKPINLKSKSFSISVLELQQHEHTKPRQYLPINNRLVQLNVTMDERPQIWSSNLLITTNQDEPRQSISQAAADLRSSLSPWAKWHLSPNVQEPLLKLSHSLVLKLFPPPPA